MGMRAGLLDPPPLAAMRENKRSESKRIEDHAAKENSYKQKAEG